MMHWWNSDKKISPYFTPSILVILLLFSATNHRVKGNKLISLEDIRQDSLIRAHRPSSPKKIVYARTADVYNALEEVHESSEENLGGADAKPISTGESKALFLERFFTNENDDETGGKRSIDRTGSESSLTLNRVRRSPDGKPTGYGLKRRPGPRYRRHTNRRPRPGLKPRPGPRYRRSFVLIDNTNDEVVEEMPATLAESFLQRPVVYEEEEDPIEDVYAIPLSLVDFERRRRAEPLPVPVRLFNRERRIRLYRDVPFNALPRYRRYLKMAPGPKYTSDDENHAVDEEEPTKRHLKMAPGPKVAPMKENQPFNILRDRRHLKMAPGPKLVDDGDNYVEAGTPYLQARRRRRNIKREKDNGVICVNTNDGRKICIVKTTEQ